jgi:hypothetical protein
MASVKMLEGVTRCPHCSVANPLLAQVWEGATHSGNGGVQTQWAAFACTSCGSIVTAKSRLNQSLDRSLPFAVYPSPPSVHQDVPDPARTFLRQAFETLHAPDAAAVMAGSAVDAMLKHFGYLDGSLYSRIDAALKDHLLTTGMADWAHSVRLGSNRPRHADKDSPHVSAEDAQRSVAFAKALGDFLFVLTAQIADAVQRVSGSENH